MTVVTNFRAYITLGLRPNHGHAMRSAIIGTSHLAMLKEAISAAPAAGFSQEEPFYLSITAPMLSWQQHQGWPAPGRMAFSAPQAKSHLQRLHGDPNLAFDPAGFETIVLVDFFFCYDFAFIMRDRNREALMVGGIPVSDHLYGRILEAQLGTSQYGAHSAVGEVPRNSTLPLLASLRQRAPKARIILVPRPFMPAANKDSFELTLSAAEILRMGTLLEDTARRMLAPLGIHFLARLPEQIDALTGLTPDAFSKGPRSTKPDTLDEHMNAAYGDMSLSQIAALIEEKDPV